MKSLWQQILLSVLSGLVGVLLTIGYQHFFAKPQSFTFVLNGEEVTLSQSDYLAQKEENESLQNKVSNLETTNSNLTAEIESLNSQINELTNGLSDVPDVQFRNIELSIDGNSIPINSTNSSVIINNRTYYADDFINNILTSNTNVTIQDNTMYIGKIIKEKASLLDQWVIENHGVNVNKNKTDSYGKTHTNTLFFDNGNYIIYSLNEEYSLLKLNIAISEDASLDQSSVLIIKADGNVVYTSQELTKTTQAFDVFDIPINNCSLLTIEYSGDWSNRCILSDIVVYN